MKRTVAVLFLLLMLILGELLPAHATGDACSVPTVAQGEDRVTRFLLLGCDRSTKLTDSILLVSVNETQKCVSILQIPRDTYAEYTDRDYKKLNGGMQARGERGIKTFLSEALGVPIQYFLVLKLDFFRKLVDAIGGVEVEILQDMVYSDPSQDLEIMLPKGKMRLGGKEAEQFVRYRSGYVNADLGRLDAQKVFLRAFAKQCKSLSPGVILRILGLALTGVSTDVGAVDAVRVLKTLLTCDPDTVPMATLTGQAVQGKSGAWYYVLNRSGACRMLNEFAFPSTPIREDCFDPRGLFLREGNERFAKIYFADPGQLPLDSICSS